MAIRLEIEIRLDPERARELWSRAANATVFNHPAWWQAAIDAFGRSRRLIVLSVTDGRGDLVGLWPWWVKALGARESFTRVVEPVGARVTDYVAPLTARSHGGGDMTALMLSGLLRHLDPRTMVLWPKAPEPDDAATAVTAVFPPTVALVKHVDRPCLTMRLADTFAGQEKLWRSNHRGDLRRRFRRIAEEGATALWCSSDPDEIASRLPGLFDAHLTNWGERSNGSEFTRPGPRDFIQRLARTLPPELLHYSEVRVGDRPISFHFGFREDGRLLWYKPAFDIAWRQFSPGKLHIGYMTRWAIEHGLDELDLMQGTEAYKRDWATGQRPTRSFAISGRLAYPVWAWNTKVRRMAAEYRY